MTTELRTELAERLESEIRPLIRVGRREGGYDCCGCSSYDDILDHAIAVVRGETYPPARGEPMTDDIKHQCPPGWVSVPIQEIEDLRDAEGEWQKAPFGHDRDQSDVLALRASAIIARLPKPPAYTEADVQLVTEAVEACYGTPMSFGATAISILEALAESGRLKPVEEEQ